MKRSDRSRRLRMGCGEGLIARPPLQSRPDSRVCSEQPQRGGHGKTGKGKR
jgi:hypothetical protein